MQNDFKHIEDVQIKHFASLYEKFKGTPMEVSSESLEHKILRFEKISGIFREDNTFSVHDVGMGLADFHNFLKNNFPGKTIQYSGSEILPDYVEEAGKRFPECRFHLRNMAETLPDEQYDYVVMSGLFHQKRETKIGEWERFSQAIISNSFAMSTKGMAFNFVSPFVDFYQPEVYYCNLGKLLHFITDHLSRFFVVHHDYALYEFTVFVYQEEFIHSVYRQKEFDKYFS